MGTPRHHSHTRSLLATVAVAIPAMLIGSGLSAPSAQAGYVVTLEQVGANVVATGSGPIDLTGLSLIGNVGGAAGQIQTNTLDKVFDTGTGLATAEYRSITEPNFGSGGGLHHADSNSGDIVGFDAVDLFVPLSYVSGNPLSDTSTYLNQTFSSLGVTPGTYVFSWGTGANQNFTLDIVTAAVPAPLIGRGLPVLLAVGGLLFGARLLERGKRRRLQFG